MRAVALLFLLMKFRSRSLRELADMVIGDAEYFPYRSSSYITEFFEECGLDSRHDGTTRWRWTADRLEELLAESSSTPFVVPARLLTLLRVLMDKADAQDGDPDRVKALAALNVTLSREGYQAYYGDDTLLEIRHSRSNTVSTEINPHRPFTRAELERRAQLSTYLDRCSEDDLIEDVLLPLFRQLGFHRITAAGHKDKALEYGKDVWMRYVLPTQHVLYFGLQAKRGKIDAAASGKYSSHNVAALHNQALMMLGHEIFDPETNKRVLVDHAFIVASGVITKQAKNWLGEKLDVSKRSQILFLDKDDILNLHVVGNVIPPEGLTSRTPEWDGIGALF